MWRTKSNLREGRSGSVIEHVFNEKSVPPAVV
jgi:hypothetical protein